MCHGAKVSWRKRVCQKQNGKQILQTFANNEPVLTIEPVLETKSKQKKWMEDYKLVARRQ
jgi:UPF0288 family protein (methanogenesis marker protein 3)